MATTYAMYAMNFLRIDEDNNGLFVEVPGMSENWFKVRVDESELVPVSTHCKCSHFAHKGHCQHTQIVDAFYARIYKSNVVKHQESVAKASEKALEQAIDASDALDEQYEEVAFSELVLAATKGSDTLVVTPAPVATPSVKKPAILNETVNLTGATEFDGSRPLTTQEWKAIMKADRKRQQAWQDEYRAKVKEAEAIDRRGYKSSLSLVG